VYIDICEGFFLSPSLCHFVFFLDGYLGFWEEQEGEKKGKKKCMEATPLFLYFGLYSLQQKVSMYVE
jgi:hypothetical protein